MGDDSVGIRVARMLRRLALGKGVTILALPELDLSLIEAFEGARGVILVDASDLESRLARFRSIPYRLGKSLRSKSLRSTAFD